MERAGRGVAQAAVDLLGGTYGRRAVVVCGKGNNGGDGLVAARHLARWGMARRGRDRRVPEACASRPRRTSRGYERDGRSRRSTPTRLPRELARADVAVDAIFGTGLPRHARGRWAAAIARLNAAGVPVVAVDIPSGVDGDTGAVGGRRRRAPT